MSCWWSCVELEVKKHTKKQRNDGMYQFLRNFLYRIVGQYCNAQQISTMNQCPFSVETSSTSTSTSGATQTIWLEFNL